MADFVDEFWRIFLEFFQAVAVFAARLMWITLCAIGSVLNFLLKYSLAACIAIEDWEPIKPHIFEAKEN